VCGLEVFCTSETFRASCPAGQVVIIRRALYGRLTAGRCITSEYAHALGCYADVTSHVQDACSSAAWRQNCSLLVATVDAIAQPCGKDFKSYLDIEHDCVTGMNIQPSSRYLMVSAATVRSVRDSVGVKISIRVSLGFNKYVFVV